MYAPWAIADWNCRDELANPIVISSQSERPNVSKTGLKRPPPCSDLPDSSRSTLDQRMPIGRQTPPIFVGLAAAILALPVVACALLGGCANPITKADQIAFESGYERLRLNGVGFEHVAYYKPGDGGRSLHVYIEHDGTPWITPTQPARDPTPTNPLMLKLMSLDPAPALYLGRPCYFATSGTPPCAAIWWTHRRFAPKVIQSMEAALHEFLAKHRGFESIELFGFSGGGVIAALMAPAFASTTRLVTVAAPLDLDEWTRVHQYTPLEGSLSPLRQPPLPPSIRQLHLVGSDDTAVDGKMIKPFVTKQPAAEFREIPGFDHYCCWDRVWTGSILAQR